MSEYSETVAEKDNYRVRLELDDSPEMPYDDGAPIVLRIDRTGYSVEILNGQGKYGRPNTYDDAIENALVHWATTPSDSDWPKFEKWARAFLGTSRIDTWYSEGYQGWYVALDTAEWRRYTGWSEEDDAKAREILARESFLAEWEAWATGEVYGYVVEKRVREETVTRELDGTEISRDETDAWEEVEAVGGFYGNEYATEAAEEALKSFTTE